MNLRSFKTPLDRREALEKERNIQLKSIGSYVTSDVSASEKNCENMIGYMQIPIGVAGPLKILHSKNEQREYFVPLATTEGALVASVSRGCKAISESGGATVFSQKVGVTRGPVFYTGSLSKGVEFSEWILKHRGEIGSIAESTSGHLIFKDIHLTNLTNYTFLRFSYDSQDAMGMNMATIATSKAVDFIEKETGVKCLSVAGNFDVDKKPAWINSIQGRGIKSWADVVIPASIVEKTLKTTPKKFFDTWLSKVMLGSAISGSMGFNAHIANVVAAIFLATGQDSAHVVEGSQGITNVNILKNGDLYVGVYLPSLMVGTVGGGTALSTQSEALSLLNVSGEGKVMEFSEIIAAAVLAGEISLLSSLSVGTLSSAHQELGRGVKI